MPWRIQVSRLPSPRTELHSQNLDGLNKDYAARDWLRNSFEVSPFSLTWSLSFS